MRAIVKFEAGPGAVRYVEHPDPQPGLDEIVEDRTPVLVSPHVNAGAGTIITVGREEDRSQLEVARSMRAVTATTETAGTTRPLADRLRPLVTHTLPLSAFDEAVQHVEDRTAIKVLLDPTYAPCEWPPRPSARSGTD